MKYSFTNNQLKDNFLKEGNSYIKKIEDKIKDGLNNYCVECGEENPDFISINNGIFLCRDCVQNHFNFPKNISKIKKNIIQSLTLNEIQYLLCGGNISLLNFICNEYPKLAELPSNILYRTHAMIYYRQYLQFLINGRIPPIKPSFNIAYKIPKLYDTIKNNNIGIIHQNRIYNTEDDNLFDNNSAFYKTEYNFIRDENNNKQQLYTNIDNNRLTINNNFNNTIGNKPINYDNYYINRPKQVNFQNNNNIIIGNRMEFIDKMNISKNKILYNSGKTKIKKNNNINEYINTININNINSVNNINTDVYIKPKLILSHNVSKSCLINKNNLIQRESSYNKNYFYSQTNIRPMGSKIDSIQLNFSKDLKNNSKINKNLSYEEYKKTKHYMKSKKDLHKSYSQKMFNNNNYSFINKNYFDNNSINNNKYTLLYQTENNQYIPIKNSTINYINNSTNNICITTNEEFQIISDKKNNGLVNNINKFKKNDNNNFINDKNENKNLHNSPINIKVNKKDNKKDNNFNIYNEENKIKEIKIDYLVKDISKKENIKNFISKCNKKRIILREREKNKLINKKNKKEKKENNKNTDNNKGINKQKRSAIKNSSQKDNLKQLNSDQKINDNQNEQKNSSIRKKYKGTIKNK